MGESANAWDGLNMDVIIVTIVWCKYNAMPVKPHMDPVDSVHAAKGAIIVLRVIISAH